MPWAPRSRRRGSEIWGGVSPSSRKERSGEGVVLLSPELFLSFRFRSDSDSFSRFLALYKFVCIVCMIFVKIEWFN